MRRSIIKAITFVLALGLIQSISFAEDGHGYGNKDYHDMPLDKKF